MREDIIAKMKKADKSKPAKTPKDKTNPNPFRKISYNTSNGGGFMEAYSLIDYDSINNEVWSTSITEGTCIVEDGDHDNRENECRGAYVNAILSDPDGTGVAAENVSGSENNAEAYLYWTPIMEGQYCVDAEHYVEDTDYSLLYAQTSDCLNVEFPQTITNVTALGAEKISEVLGNSEIIHFVTPKGEANSQVTLTATITPSNQQSLDNISWEGAIESANNPLVATLPKDSASKNVVKIKYYGKVIKELRVWVVWTELTPTSQTGPLLRYFPFDLNVFHKWSTSIVAVTEWKATISPPSIIDSNEADRPDLTGVNVSDPPGSGTFTVLGDDLREGLMLNGI